MVTALQRFHERIPSYSVTEGEHVVYRQIPGVRQAVKIPISFPAS
jgi:hypothetical protein